MTSKRFVYFIRSESGRVKIGMAADVARRLAILQTASADRLDVIGVCEGGASREKEIHAIFRDSRKNGEWFAETPAIHQWVSENTVSFDPIVHTSSVPDARLREIAAASAMLKSLAEPRPPGENVLQSIRRVSEMLNGVGFSRVKCLWYKDTKVCLTATEFNEIVRVSGSQIPIRAEETFSAVPRDDVLAALNALSVKIDSLTRGVNDLRKVLSRESGRTWLELLHDDVPSDGITYRSAS